MAMRQLVGNMTVSNKSAVNGHLIWRRMKLLVATGGSWVWYFNAQTLLWAGGLPEAQEHMGFPVFPIPWHWIFLCHGWHCPSPDGVVPTSKGLVQQAPMGWSLQWAWGKAWPPLLHPAFAGSTPKERKAGGTPAGNCAGRTGIWCSGIIVLCDTMLADVCRSWCLPASIFFWDSFQGGGDGMGSNLANTCWPKAEGLCGEEATTLLNTLVWEGALQGAFVMKSIKLRRGLDTVSLALSNCSDYLDT